MYAINQDLYSLTEKGEVRFLDSALKKMIKRIDFGGK